MVLVYLISVVDCGPVPVVSGAEEPTGGWGLNGDTLLEQTFSLECLVGFNLRGSNTGGDENNIACLASGSWDLGNYTCIGMVYGNLLIQRLLIFRRTILLLVYGA